MSIRNMDADVASNKLNELFHLHRYEDCVLFINRLSHLTIKLVISQISVDMYMSRLPYTLEIFEALYAKVFIMDPDNFPVRALQPERVIDKMVAYFSLLSDQSGGMEPIDGAKMLDSFENVIRIISYVQPNLYSRLLYFKYAIDKGLLRLEKDLAYYSNTIRSVNLNHQQQSPMHDSSRMSTSMVVTSSPSSSASYLNVGSLKKQSKTKTSLANSILISRVSNMQSCEQLRTELTLTIQNCNQSLAKINEFITQLKSQKQFKEIQFYLNQTHQKQQNSRKDLPESELNQQEELNCDEDAALLKSSHVTQTPPKPKLNKSLNKPRSESAKTSMRRDKSNDALCDSDEAMIPQAVVCQDVIQNRLYLNKAMMNTVEPYLQTVKLQQLLNSLYEKIDLDKEILLVFTHLKREERHLSSVEPLLPLFRRYSLGFERCIQIWRRKCSADSLLLFNDRLNGTSSKCKEYQQQLDKLYIVDNEESNQLNQLHSSYSSSALVVPTTANANNTKSAECYLTQANEMNTNLDDDNLSRIQNALNSGSAKNQKFFSEVNLYTSPGQNGYSTMPSKFKGTKMTTNLTVSSFRDSFIMNDESNSGGLFNSTNNNLNRTLNKSNLSPDLVAQASPTNNGVVHSDTFDSLSNLTDSKVSQTVLNNTEIFLKQHQNAKLKSDDFILAEKQQEIERLNRELASAKDTIDKLRKNENKLREKLNEMELNEMTLDFSVDSQTANIAHNEYTSDLIQMYANLNKIYRAKAYDSLNSVKEIQGMNEFKMKLLFSVVILAYRYVKLYIRDLKRRVKAILQISDNTNTNNKTNSIKNTNTTSTPTIVIQKASDYETSTESSSEKTLKYQQSNATTKSSEIIENALNKYLQIVTTSKTFDLNKIVEDVKEQLWTTLYDYPLKECHDLNNFINESVKTSWSLINHDPPFKLDYNSNRFDSKIHERTESSNRQSELISQYVWPSLMDSSDNFCLSKAIVIT